MKKEMAVILAAAAIMLSGCAREVSNSSDSSVESQPGTQTSDNSSKEGSQKESSETPSKTQDPGGSSGNSPQTEAPSNTNNADVWQMSEEYRKIEPDFSDKIASLYGLGVMPGHVLLSTTSSDMQTDRTVMDYNLKNNTWQEVGNYDEIYTMSANQLQIGQKNYFAYDSGGQYRMACIDFASQEVTYPNTFEYSPPLASYEALDNKQFFLYLPNVESSGEQQYRVCLYNTEENSYQEILTETYSETQGTGNIIVDISAQDQLLYAFYKSGTGTQKIMVYNAAGELQQEIVLEDLQMRLKQSGEYVFRFFVLGDCFFFETLGSGSQYLYSYENGALQLLNLPSGSLRLDDQRGDNLRDRQENPYYYFWDSSAKTLYPFNCQTKSFSRLQLGDADDKNLSIGIWDDAQGNLMMSYYQNGQGIPNYYYIPQSTILKYME